MYQPTDWIKTRRDLVNAILDTGDVQDFEGFCISPKIEIEDENGNLYQINDFYLSGADSIKIKIGKK